MVDFLQAPIFLSHYGGDNMTQHVRGGRPEIATCQHETWHKMSKNSFIKFCSF